MISLALIPIVVGAFFEVVERNNNKRFVDNIAANHIVLHTSKALFWLGLTDVLVFLFFIIFSVLSKQNGVLIFIGLGIFVFLGIMLIFQSLIFRIDLYRDKSYFVYRTIWGKSVIIQYAKCESYRVRKNSTTIKTDKRTIRVDNLFVVNSDFLLVMLELYNIQRIE